MRLKINKKLLYLAGWGVVIFAALPAQAAYVDVYAPPVQRFIPVPPSAPPAQRFIPVVPEVPRNSFRPVAPSVSSAPIAPQPAYAPQATRFIPNNAYVAPASQPPPAPYAPRAQEIRPQAPEARVADRFYP